jgi:nitrite reductase (NADH) small subunit
MTNWIEVCRIDDLQPDSGVCALVQGEQVAVFYLAKLNAIYALGNYDPFCHANVLSRGMIGDIGGQPMVASPMYKQHFNLQTGVCFEDQSIAVPCYPVSIEQDRVRVKMPASLNCAERSAS